MNDAENPKQLQKEIKNLPSRIHYEFTNEYADGGAMYDNGGGVEKQKVTLVGIIDDIDTSNKTFSLYIPKGDISGKISGRKKFVVNYENVSNAVGLIKGKTISVDGYLRGNLIYAIHILFYSAKGGAMYDGGGYTEKDELNSKEQNAIKSIVLKGHYGASGSLTKKQRLISS